jgi:hypothetical protein
MSLLTATTVAALLVASPSSTDADRLAANGGFLLGNAQRCGIAAERVERAGQLIRELVLAAARDEREEEESKGRLAAFFLVSAAPDDGKKTDDAKKRLVVSCRLVKSEFTQFERYHFGAAAPNAPTGTTTKRRFGPGDGE